MNKSIPIALNPSTIIEIDAAIVAAGLGLADSEFRALMEQGKIALLCERGVGADAGLYRASYYYKGKRLRLVVDRDGKPVT